MFSKYSLDESAIVGLVTPRPGKNVQLCSVIVLFKQKGKTPQVCLCHSLCSVCLCFALLLVVVFFCFFVRHLFDCLFEVCLVCFSLSLLEWALISFVLCFRA